MVFEQTSERSIFENYYGVLHCPQNFMIFYYATTKIVLFMNFVSKINFKYKKSFMIALKECNKLHSHLLLLPDNYQKSLVQIY